MYKTEVKMMLQEAIAQTIADTLVSSDVEVLDANVSFCYIDGEVQISITSLKVKNLTQDGN